MPGHWTIEPLKKLCSFNDNVLPETTDPDEEIEYVDISSVSVDLGIEKTESLRFKDAPSRARRKVVDGDVIVSTVRTYLKAIASIKSPPSNLIVSTGFAVIRPKAGFSPQFANYSLQSEYFMSEVIARSVGVSYPAINSSELVGIFMATPPTQEQFTIATFLDRETTKIDILIAKAKRSIELLQEHRTSLISAAVTGKIDVRNLVKPPNPKDEQYACHPPNSF